MKNGFMCCMGKLFVFLVWACAFFALPIVGLVFWYVLKTPEQFMLTCIGICVASVGFGVFAFLSMYGYAKYKHACDMCKK